jgi:hypothetical protein
MAGLMVGRPGRAEEERIAVGLRRRDRLGADRSAGSAGAVLDHEWLPERRAEPICDEAGDNVNPAGRERHDHLDWAARIALGPG